MKYILLLWPHANARYQAESAKLAKGELTLMLSKLNARIDNVSLCDVLPNAIEFSCNSQLSDTDIKRISEHSLAYELFEEENKLLKPVSHRAEVYLGADLPAILKYKGKTNEIFTLFTINIALCASDFFDCADEKLRFLDPMCSKGTSLFQAINKGWNADGTDVARDDLRELTQFFKKYLEYHKIKHTKTQKSYTVKGQRPSQAIEFSFADSQQAYKDNNILSLRVADCDCGGVTDIFGKSKYHIISCDLPYGVQHSPNGDTLEGLLKRSLPNWFSALKPGGAIAISYNTNTLRTQKLRDMMKASGFDVMSGGCYDDFSHWVEQAVERDVAVGKKH